MIPASPTPSTPRAGESRDVLTPDGLPIFFPARHLDMEAVAKHNHETMLNDEVSTEDAQRAADARRQVFAQYECEEIVRILEKKELAQEKRLAAAQALSSVDVTWWDVDALRAHAAALGALCRSSEAITRHAAVIAMARLPGATYLETHAAKVIALVADENQQVRVAAASALERCTPRFLASHVDILVRNLRHSDAGVRRSALSLMRRLDAIALVGHARALTSLCQSASEHSDVRHAARVMLARIQAPPHETHPWMDDGWHGLAERDKPGWQEGGRRGARTRTDLRKLDVDGLGSIRHRVEEFPPQII